MGFEGKYQRRVNLKLNDMKLSSCFTEYDKEKLHKEGACKR